VVTVEKSSPVAQLIPCVENGGGLPEKSDFYFHSSRKFVGSSTGIHRRPSQDARGNSPESPRASSASGLTDLDADEIDTGQPTKDAIQEHPSHGQVYPHDLAPTDVSQDLETTSVDQVTGNGTADFTDPEDHSNGANFLPLFELEAYTEFGLGELDWLNFELDSPNSLRIESEYVAREGDDYPENHDQAPYQPLLSSDETREAHSVAPQLSTHPISAHNNNCSRPRTHHSGTRTGREQWPFDYSASSNPKKVQLPPLRQILESTVRPKRAIHRATHASLIELLSSPYLPPMDEVLEFHTMPAIVLLKQFLNLYLTEFNSVIPMIHVPTWELSTCPSVLLAAMACIGAGFSDAEGSVELQASLSEISLQTLSWLVSIC
jgi:Fungal specific transcription factor domain